MSHFDPTEVAKRKDEAEAWTIATSYAQMFGHAILKVSARRYAVVKWTGIVLEGQRPVASCEIVHRGTWSEVREWYRSQYDAANLPRVHLPTE